jgi:hypothetical protein
VPEAIGFQDVLVTEADHPGVKYWWPRGHVIGWEHAHINELFHYLSAIANGSAVEPCGATFEDGYRNVVICDAIACSVRSRTREYVQFEL